MTPTSLCCYGGFSSYRISRSSLQHDENGADFCKLGLPLWIQSSLEPQTSSNIFLLRARKRALPSCHSQVGLSTTDTTTLFSSTMVICRGCWLLHKDNGTTERPWPFLSPLCNPHPTPHPNGSSFTKATLKPLSSPAYTDAQKNKISSSSLGGKDTYNF